MPAPLLVRDVEESAWSVDFLISDKMCSGFLFVDCLELNCRLSRWRLFSDVEISFKKLLYNRTSQRDWFWITECTKSAILNTMYSDYDGGQESIHHQRDSGALWWICGLVYAMCLPHFGRMAIKHRVLLRSRYPLSTVFCWRLWSGCVDCTAGFRRRPNRRQRDCHIWRDRMHD